MVILVSSALTLLIAFLGTATIFRYYLPTASDNQIFLLAILTLLVTIYIAFKVYCKVKVAPREAEYAARKAEEDRIERERESIYAQYLSEPSLLNDPNFASVFASRIQWWWIKSKVQGPGKFYGARCAHCHKWARRGDAHLDHIKPKSKYPELAYAITNLQYLCAKCNRVKHDYDGDDWRQVIKSRKRRITIAAKKKSSQQH